MEKELLQVFNLISKLKDVRKQSYVIDRDSVFIIYNYWRLYELKKFGITLKKFKNIMVDYSVISGKDLHQSCEDFCKKISIE